VLKEGASATEAEIANHVAGLVAPYKQLRGGVVFTNEIPKSVSGKILRRVVREQDEKLRAQEQEQQQPQQQQQQCK
jgi:acyl-coenzyme A synthetase/AMP-(fatty) acid ligase